MKTYQFNNEQGGWYIDLPEYLAQGGSKGDLAMVAGADTMLDTMSEGKDSISITIDTNPFAGADELVLDEVCHPSMGGGYYIMPEYEGKKVDHRMWLCAVTNFVFGYLPEKIFIKRAGKTVGKPE
jgi:hypothetical protein